MLPDQGMLKNQIKSLLTSFEQDPDKYDSDKAVEDFADGLSKIILETIKAGTVTFTVGTVTGTTPPGGGALVAGAAINGKIS